MKNTRANCPYVFDISLHICIRHVEVAVVMMPKDRVILMVKAVAIGRNDPPTKNSHRHSEFITSPFPAIYKIRIFNGRTVCIYIEMQGRTACSTSGVIINIFDGCSIETIRINGGTHTHNYGQRPESLKVPCSQELVGMLNVIARALGADASELAHRYVLQGVQKDWGRVFGLPASMRG